ncbi:MAG: gliding motility-associated C-terminal domain-containing protein [Bacteroidales bacterium]|nr:gliding motility-associated C-terminal domain-containing protein [Bacteroidales bacterium]
MKYLNKILSFLFFLVILSGFNSYAQTLPVACGDGEVMYGVVGDNGNSTFYWEVTGGTFIDYNDSILVTWNDVAGMHYIKVTEENIYGCIGEQLVDSVIVTIPFVDVGLDAEICQGESYTFEADASTVSFYLWEDGSTGETFIATISGDYWVRVEDANGCTAADTAALIAHELPIVDLGPDTTLSDDASSILFDVYNDGAIYDWFNGDISSSYTAYAQTIDQEIWVNVTSDFGCVATDTVVVRSYGEIEIPTAFTPNDDGINDVWEIEQLFVFDKVTVDVYNRWGERVFHSDGYTADQYWNGTNAKGKKLPMDAYYYVIDLHNDEEPIVGTVTIIR